MRTTRRSTPGAWQAGDLVWIVALAALVGAGAMLLLSDDAEATHYWAGTLQWNRTEAPDGVDRLVDQVAPTVYVSGKFSFRWSWEYTYETPTGVATIKNPPMCTTVHKLGLLQHTSPNGPQEVDFHMVVVFIDPDRDRAIFRIVRPGADGPSVCAAAANARSYDVPIQFATQNQDDGSPHKVWWDSAARISFGSKGNYHVNNHDRPMHLETFVDLESPNNSPIAELIPIRFCPVDALCRFPMNAQDPDHQALTFRLATNQEAVNFGAFHQPGPTCNRCATVENVLSIDRLSGQVTWDTTGAEVVDTCAPEEQGCPKDGRRNLYSMQVMIEDGQTNVPNDFMIELLEPPESMCPDGSVPPIDQWTGEYRVDWCEVPVPPCSTPEAAADPECQPPLVPEPLPYKRGQPNPPNAHWMPEPSYPITKNPALSDLNGRVAGPMDRVNEAIANLDSDNDGHVDRVDLCPNTPSVQSDLDGNIIGDACDDDRDGDGKANGLDPCPEDPLDACVDPAEVASATSLASQEQGDLANRGATTPARDSEEVSVQMEAAKKSPAGMIMLAVLGGALLVLLLAMAMRRR